MSRSYSSYDEDTYTFKGSKKGPRKKSAAYSKISKKNHNKKMKEFLNTGEYEPALCPSPEKRAYSQRTFAIQEMRDIQENPHYFSEVKPQRAYKCSCGAWHLTSMREGKYNFVTDKASESLAEGLERIKEEQGEELTVFNATENSLEGDFLRMNLSSGVGPFASVAVTTGDLVSLKEKRAARAAEIFQAALKASQSPERSLA